MGATKARHRLVRLPRSIPRPTLSPLTAAVPHPGQHRAGVAEERRGHGGSRTLHVRGVRHYGSGVVESEDQHEREMENKEQ